MLVLALRLVLVLGTCKTRIVPVISMKSTLSSLNASRQVVSQQFSLM